MLYLVIIILILFSMKFIILHQKMGWFFDKLKNYMEKRPRLLLVCYCIFNIFWILVNMYLKLMVFMGKIIMSFNNIYIYLVFALIRLIITSILSTWLIFLNYIIEAYKNVSEQFSIMYLIKIMIMVLSFLYVWHVIFEIEVFRIFVFLSIFYVKVVIDYIMDIIIKGGILAFYKNPWYPVLFKKKEKDMVIFLLLHIEDYCWYYFLNNGKRRPRTVTKALTASEEAFNEPFLELLIRINEKIHKNTYIGFMYEAGAMPDIDAEKKDFMEMLFKAKLLGNLSNAYASSSGIFGFADFDFFVRVYFYKKYGNYSIIDYRKQLLFTEDFRNIKICNWLIISKLQSYEDFIYEYFPEKYTKLKNNERYYWPPKGIIWGKDLGKNADKDMLWKYWEFEGIKYLEDIMDTEEVSMILAGEFYTNRLNHMDNFWEDYKGVYNRSKIREIISYIYFFLLF